MELRVNQSESAAAAVAPVQVSVAEFVDAIESIAAGIITKDAVRQYLATHEIRHEELAEYKSWLPDRHTRNKIFRNDRIEVMALCWPIGAQTPLHTHNGQLGWMAMVEGKLLVENYRKIRCNKPENQNVVGLDCLAGATEIEMELLATELVEPGGPLNTVDKLQTIHRIRNLAEWNERAVSLHIYSLPIDSCVVFDLEGQKCYRRDLKYDR